MTLQKAFNRLIWLTTAAAIIYVLWGFMATVSQPATPNDVLVQRAWQAGVDRQLKAHQAIIEQLQRQAGLR